MRDADLEAQLNRREFLRQLGIGAAGGVAAMMLPNWALASDATSKAARKPNVLFIAIDDLNDWVGCLGGHPDARTPNIDRLAARGMLFTNAHCAGPICNPSRASLMTGIAPSISGVYIGSQPWRRSPALANAETLPQHFRASGYEAFGAGKIYHGKFPDPESWDRYWPDPMKVNPPGAKMPKGKPQGIGKHFDWGALNVPDEEMADAKIITWAQGELAKKHDKPFFMAVGVVKPHLPWYVPKKYFDMFPPDKIHLPDVKADDLDDIPEAGKRIAHAAEHEEVLRKNKWREAVSAYLACIAFADAQIGRLIDAFDRSPDRDNTVIVLWSDHGWHLGEKLHWHKSTLWEEATRNILIVAAPGVTQPGSKCSRTVSLLDIYPTLNELCGLPKKDGLEGHSFMSLLKNPSASWDHPAVTTHLRGNHSVRSQDWRYIRYADGTEELYDHRKDHNEWTNLAGDPKYADVKKDLARYLPKNNAEPSFDRKGNKGGDGADD